MDVLGKSYVRQDGKEMVLGESEFVDDLEPKNVLYGAVVRSGRPHARILKINTKKLFLTQALHVF